MISQNKLKRITKELTGKRISSNAIKKVNLILNLKLTELLRKAERNADSAGRVTIKEEDLAEN